ncbi:MAG TPA: PEP-CTERM sorting domain-containing protein [Acidobacteriaceae bacterium]|nr:PEP-CTERM sorting domain-containing protein [Acidobacteriaceae bacterium]
MGLTGHFGYANGAVGDRRAQFFQQQKTVLRCLRMALAAAAILAAGTFTARAADIPIYNNFAASTASRIGNAVLSTDGAYYSPIIADDVTLGAGFAGSEVTGFQFSIANYNPDTTDITVFIMMYADNNGAPGALLYSTPFNGPVDGDLLVPANSGPATPLFIAPRKLWIGEMFSNVSTGLATTQAEVNNFGVGFNDGPTVGSSSDHYFVGSALTSPTAGSPVGTIETGTPGSLTFELFTDVAPAPVPEPSSLSLLVLGLGSLGGIVRRKLRG